MNFFEKKDPKFRHGTLTVGVSKKLPKYIRENVVGTKLVSQGSDLREVFDKIVAAMREIGEKKFGFAYIPTPHKAHPIDMSAYKVVEQNGLRSIVSKERREKIELALWDVPNDKGKFGYTAAIVYTNARGEKYYIYGRSSLGDTWPDGFLESGAPKYIHGDLLVEMGRTPPDAFIEAKSIVAVGKDLTDLANKMIEVATKIRRRKFGFSYLSVGPENGNGNSVASALLRSVGFEVGETEIISLQVVAVSRRS